jgi:hypothetical protein
VVSFTPLPLYPWEKTPGTNWIGGWVGDRASLDDVKKRKFLTLPGLELRPLGRPARRKSLYRLRYPGSHEVGIEFLDVISKKLVLQWDETNNEREKAETL